MRRSHTLAALTRTLCRVCGFTWMGRTWDGERDRCMRCDSVFLEVSPLNIPTNYGHKHEEKTQ